MNGFVKIHRSIIEWEWYDDHNTTRVFLHCLFMANWKDQRYRGKLIKRGTFVTGLAVFAEQVGLSIQNVRTSFSRLKSTHELTIKTSPQGSVIEVVNYDKYQLVTNEPTSSQQTTNKQLTTNEERKKEKKSIEPPSLEEVKAYFSSNGYSTQAAEKAWRYYDSGNWKDSSGKPVRSWKQKMRGVWFKDENKIKAGVSWI